ncbi:hypothetical protein BpV1_058 [Bathycoccus sp. RCC1105 virus BpV1]|uniref:hypothetical protein n=1 Tax=Bathycoccus sp. RCC1105 virus BpV1 TaxID=880159 RepID=UPI0001EF43BC|nr:hypothetical protein BpV1_058 [Bathycoccus sp. RCC1105 virus BpV1]ADQ91685.1 hypothetical protein BpV1_058 [Bathycoccus sp. RCC1105 virus BpV1]
MVKNLPTIERSTKIRFGKHASDNQAENTVVFNATDSVINAINEGSIYMAPLRVAELAGSNLVGYSASTKEVVDSSVPTSLLGGVTLDSAALQGNVVSNSIPHFANITTAFTTDHGSNVGISNTSPTHMLSVGDKIFMSNTGTEFIKVEGNVQANKFFTGSSVTIDQDATNKIQVSGIIKTGVLHVDNIGISNTSPTHALSLGNEGQLRLNVPTGSIYALETVGNVSAQNYIGDGGLLSNVTLQTVTDKSNITSNTLHLTNPTTSLKAYSNIIVDGKITVGTPIETTSGGTGHDTYIPGTILYGTDTGTSLGRLVPAVSNQDAGKFLRLDASDIPEWAEVPLTLDAVLGDTTAISDGSMDLTGTGTTITTAGKIKAASFEGVGSEIEGINAANVASLSGSTLVTGVLPIVPVTKGGTGLTTVAQNDLLLGPSSGDALAKLSAYTGPTSITAPPSGMTSTTQTIGGIQYTSSASSTMSGTTTYNAFDYNNTTIWRSGILDDYSDMDGYYEGSTTTGSYSGEWIQIYRATAIAPTSIQIIPAQTTHAAPNVWKVFGSTNGSSWTEIHSSTTAVTWNSGNGHTATISGSAAYNYLRLAVQMSTIPNSLGTIAVSEVRFSAQGTGPTEKFLRSSAAGVSWDAVSSTLQTITDGGASTTNEISFTNGVTSLTASGNVVVTGNVTASTFKSTTLTSGKIPYTNANKELIDGPIGHDSTTNNTFVSSNLYVTGNLTVQGTTTFQDSNIHTVSDPIIEIGNANAIDTIDMGIIMTRPTANVVAGYMGDEKKYVIAYTLTDPDGAHIVPTNATSDQFMTLSVEGGNVLAGNVTTTGLVEAATLKGDGSAITSLNPANLSSQVLLAKGGTGLTSVAENELLLGPASGTALTKLTPYAPAGTTVEYPTSALSSAANSGETIAGVTYTTTASSNQYGQIWKAFDKSTPGQNTFWHSDENVYDSTSGAYTGSNSLGGVSGEWIKLQLSTGIAPTSVNITGRTQYDNQAPDSWEILGSTNNSSWTSLLSSTVHATYNGGSGHTVSISGASAYTYLALVVKARGGTGQTAVVISELRFFITSANLSKKFLRSSGTGIAWDDVSSDLQTITDGGATTTHTVAFNNTTTGLTSAGDIDIAATKQIDYAGDVLLKSSAGTVASLKVDNAIKLDPAYAAPSNNVLSFNTTTGEIYDSGGQGGSTLDNIHEEGSNVAIGPSAASANLTVNTYGSNVLTVSGNVSADNITIGALNVAASPFALDDVVSVNAGANVTANVLTLGGLVTSGNVDASNIIVSGNTTSQNIKLTNTDISATISSGTITIDAREKSYGTAPLVVSTTDVSNLVFSNLITGAQIVVPILASGGDINISKELTNVNFYAMTSDVSITQDKHALMTLSNLYGNIYMNAIGFA